MAKHITHKKLAGLVAGTLSPRQAGIAARHLEECDRCRGLHGRIIAATAPRYRSLMPREELKARVLRSWQELQAAEKRPSGLTALIAAHSRGIMAGAFAVIAAAVTALIIYTLRPGIIEPPSLTASLVTGKVIINGATARPNDRVRAGSAITLDRQDMVRLAYGSAVSITLFGRGSFTVDRMRIGASGRLELVCTLDEGILLSRTTSPVSYAYNTPGARIEPRGTEFLLQAAGAKTLVIMKQGSVTVKPAKTGESLEVSAGTRCVIDRAAAREPASPKDLEMFGNMERLRTGEFAPQLLMRPGDKEKGAGDDTTEAGNKTANIVKIKPVQKTQASETDTVRQQQDRSKTEATDEGERRARNARTGGSEKIQQKRDQTLQKEIRRRSAAPQRRMQK